MQANAGMTRAWVTECENLRIQVTFLSCMVQ